MIPEKCRLYLISPPKFDIEIFAEQLQEALGAGDVAAFQLRMKVKDGDNEISAPREEIIKAAATLMPICKKYGVQFIVNDSPEIAKELGADGVHIGIEDCDAKQARAIMGDEMVVGVSCYDSLDRAMIAGENDADYVAFGAFYPTKTKKPRGFPKPELLKSWSKNSVMASVAIGGIKPDNLAPLVQSGADFIAVVTGVWDHPKGAAAAIEEYNAAISKSLGEH